MLVEEAFERSLGGPQAFSHLGDTDLSGVAVPIKVTGPWSNISYQPDLAGALKEQIKDPSAVMEKMQDEEGAKGLIEGLVPGAAPDSAVIPPAGRGGRKALPRR